MTNSVRQVQRLGQSIWYDNIRRGLIRSGELQSLIDLGVTGVTSNLTIFEKAIAGSTDYDETLLELANDGKSAQELFEAFAVEDIQATADLLRPVYDRTVGVDGYASLEVSPRLAHDTQGTISEVERLFDALDRPNVMVKVPATPEGIAAIRHLTGQGIHLNVTLIFSLEAHRQVMEAYISGLEDLAHSGGNISKVASVASFFVSRVDVAVDALLEERAQQGQQGVKTLMGKAAIANAKQAYQSFKAVFGGDRFAVLHLLGARVQRPLWGSTGTKNSSYSDVLYIDSLIGEDTVNTVPPATLTAFIEHGQAKATLEQNVADSEQTMKALAAAGVSIDNVTNKLLTDGVKSFADSFTQLLANVEDKKSLLLAQGSERRASASETVRP